MSEVRMKKIHSWKIYIQHYVNEWLRATFRLSDSFFRIVCTDKVVYNYMYVNRKQNELQPSLAKYFVACRIKCLATGKSILYNKYSANICTVENVRKLYLLTFLLLLKRGITSQKQINLVTLFNRKITSHWYFIQFSRFI